MSILTSRIYHISAGVQRLFADTICNYCITIYVLIGLYNDLGIIISLHKYYNNNNNNNDN